MIEADVGDDAVRPGIKAALEAETRQILVNFQEGFLIDVAGIFGLVQNVQGDSQDVAVVAVHQLFKRFAVAALRAFDQGALIGRSQAAPRDSQGRGASRRDLRRRYRTRPSSFRLQPS